MEASQATAKLIDISDLIGADEILLATTAPGPRHEDDPRDELPENSYTP